MYKGFVVSCGGIIVHRAAFFGFYDTSQVPSHCAYPTTHTPALTLTQPRPRPDVPEDDGLLVQVLHWVRCDCGERDGCLSL